MYTSAGSKSHEVQPVTVKTLRKMKQAGEKIACLTAYDASFAALIDAAGTDLVLVGDSLGMVIQGHDSTVPVTLDDMVYHAKAVVRGIQHALFVVDMPFMSYATPEQALANAARLMQEGGAKMVKLEGGVHQVEVVEYLTTRGIPVCAHIGLQPQMVHKLGGFRVQGKDADTAKQMRKDAVALERAGADIILLECVPDSLAADITVKSKVPVIGIGAGPKVDGQILVSYDMLDITPGHKPRFVRNFMEGRTSLSDGVRAYVDAVRDGSYPGPEHSFGN